jgi:hypothetical protein
MAETVSEVRALCPQCSQEREEAIVHPPGLLHIGGSAYCVWAEPPNCGAQPTDTEKDSDAPHPRSQREIYGISCYKCSQGSSPDIRRKRPCQYRRLRRCGNGPEHVSFHHASHAQTKGEGHGPR